jgi:L-iditol 2-dehydrogenase
MITYKAFYAKVPMQFELRQVETAPLQPDEVLVQVKACGVCSWDVLCAQELLTDWGPIGHEMSGRVVEVGNAVTGYRLGDRVICENSTFCGVCDHCKRGDVVNCTNLDHFRSPGAFSELLKVKCTSLYPIDDLEYCAAALAEPLTVAIDMVQAAEIPLGGRVAVFGPGPIGLMIAKLAQITGAEKVYLTGPSRLTARWEAARRLGINDLVMIDQVDPVAYIREREPLGVDRVLVTAPPTSVADAVKITRFGGIIAYDGIKFGQDGMITVDGNAFHFNRLQLRGVHSIPNLGWPQALSLLRSRQIDPAVFITQVYPFSQVPEAVSFAAAKHDKAVKVMVDFEA